MRNRIIAFPEKHCGGYATEALYLVLKYVFEELHRIVFETAWRNEGMRDGWPRFSRRVRRGMLGREMTGGILPCVLKVF
jgi:hypothetical protein